MLRFPGFILALVLLVVGLAAPSRAQIPGGGVSQSGTVTTGNCTKWLGNGVIADAGSGCGGSGSPGGSNTQVQYNAAGSFAGISGATSNGTTLTLVAPILGTPASGTLTNTTGLPISTGVSGLATGIATWLATSTSANLAAALTDETGSGAAVFGTAPTISSPTIGTATTFSFVTGSTQCLHVNTSGVLSGTGSDCGGSGVTSVATACGISGGPITATGTVQSTANPTTQAGANYAFLAADMCTTVYLNNASNQIPTIPAANTTGFESGKFIEVCNIGAGTQTITPTTSTIGGAATYVLLAGSAAAPKCVGIIANGSNYTLDQTPNLAAGATGANPTATASDVAVNGSAATFMRSDGAPAIQKGSASVFGLAEVDNTSLAATAGVFSLKAFTGDCTTSAGAVSITCTKTNGTAFGALATVSAGTGVATAAAANLSAAGGLTSTIASGTSAMGTGAITSATCATVVTTAATNTATTDVVLASFNGDPTAVTGYIPATAGMLTIIAYPTSGNVNFKVCNNTSSSVTPGAITLNWRVVR